MRRTLLLLAAALVVLAGPGAWAELLSKSYEFKPGVILEIGASTANGIRLDSARFHIPSTLGGDNLRTGGLVQVEIALSNTANDSRKVGLAVALFDEQRLLGVAAGGSRLMGVRPGRQKVFKLVFDHVNSEAFRARTFQVTVETPD